MPLFEYECKDCEIVEEKLRSFEKRREAAICQHCGGVMIYVDRIHPSKFMLKGGGWYKDGYSNVTNISDSKKTNK